MFQRSGRSFYFVVLILLAALFSLTSVTALQISPAIVDVEYTESGTTTFDVTIINDISQDIVIELSYESYEGKLDYTDYFSVEGYPTNKVPVTAGTEKDLQFTLQFPPLESFGHTRFALIHFYQAPFDSSADVGATVAVIIPVETTIAYPEKYVKIDLDTVGVVEPASSVPLQVTLTNKGSHVIDSVTGSFVVTNGVTTKTVPFDSDISLFLQEEQKSLVGTLDTAGMDPGKYNVTASIVYDGETKDSAPVTLIIGEKAVEIVDAQPRTLNSNSPNTLTLSFLNLWVEDVSPSVSVHLVSSNGDSVASSDIGAYTLPIENQKDITGTLTLEDIDSGDYTLQVIVTLDGESFTKDFPVTVAAGGEVSSDSSTGESSSNLVYIIIIVLLILVVFIILFFFWHKKKKEEASLVA